MPLFAQLVASLFTGLSAFLVKAFAAKVAIRVAAVGALAASGAALMIAFNTVVAPLVGALFSTAYGQLIGLAFPPVAGTVLAGVATVWVSCTTYKLQAQAIKLAAGL